MHCVRTLTQCIQQHITSTHNQTTLGLAVKLHHKYGSYELIKTPNDHGLATDYAKILGFHKSAAWMLAAVLQQDLLKDRP